LLFESRRVPEIVVILKCKEATTFNRIIKSEEIKAEYERLVKMRKDERAKVREGLKEEERKRIWEAPAEDAENVKSEEEKLAELNAWEENKIQEDEAAEEGDPEKPDLEAMLEKEREALRESRTNDDAFFEEFSNVLKEKQVFVVDDIRADQSLDFVFIKLLDRIKDNLQYRKDMLER
jgi:hypothetical protein